MMDLQKVSQGRLPSAKNIALIKNDRAFQGFMEGVIMCTEQTYEEAALEIAVKKEYKTEYKGSYVDLISKIVEELLIEGKLNKL